MIIQSLLFLLTSLTVFLIFTEILTINISYEKNTVIDINFTVLALRLINDKDNKKTTKRKKKKIKDLRSLKNIILLISRKCEVTIHEIYIPFKALRPSNFAIKKGLYTTLLSYLLSYIENNSKKLKVNNIIIDDSGNNNYTPSFYISLKLSLITLLTLLPKLIKIQMGKV